MAKITLGLSPRRKNWMIINGIIWLLVGILMAGLILNLQRDISIDVVAVYLVFGILGLTPIFHAIYSKIEFDGDKIFYTQPLFTISCKWDDFIGLRISSDGVALRFLDSRITTLKFIARALKYLGLWNNTIPLSSYLTFENRIKVWGVIEPYLEDDQEKKILELLLTG